MYEIYTRPKSRCHRAIWICSMDEFGKETSHTWSYPKSEKYTSKYLVNDKAWAKRFAEEHLAKEYESGSLRWFEVWVPSEHVVQGSFDMDPDETWNHGIRVDLGFKLTALRSDLKKF